MQQVTRWVKNKDEIEFAEEQIEKQKPGVCVYKKNAGNVALFRTDKN